MMSELALARLDRAKRYREIKAKEATDGQNTSAMGSQDTATVSEEQNITNNMQIKKEDEGYGKTSPAMGSAGTANEEEQQKEGAMEKVVGIKKEETEKDEEEPWIEPRSRAKRCKQEPPASEVLVGGTKLSEQPNVAAGKAVAGGAARCKKEDEGAEKEANRHDAVERKRAEMQQALLRAIEEKEQVKVEEVDWRRPSANQNSKLEERRQVKKETGHTRDRYPVKKEEASQSVDVIMISSSDEEEGKVKEEPSNEHAKEIRDMEERLTHMERERRRQANQPMNATETKYCPTKFIPALERAMKHTELEYPHQKWALGKAKKSLIEAAKRGETVTLGSLHRLPNVGLWVEQQISEYLHKAPSPPRISSSHAASSSMEHSMPQPQPTPNSIDWHYCTKAGCKTELRQHAEMKPSPMGNTYRVLIKHASGLIEKAYLPELKAPLKKAL